MALRKERLLPTGMGGIVNVATDHMAITGPLLFSLVCVVGAVIADFAGFPTIAGMAIAYAVVMSIVSFVFITVPMIVLEKFFS